MKALDRDEDFVEELGLLLDSYGFSRMAGRVLGQLIFDGRPHTQAELVSALGVSLASISAAVRYLVEMDFVERVPVRGRRDVYRIAPDGWHRVLQRNAHVMTAYRELAERGLARARSGPGRRALEEMHEYFSFFEREYPAMLARFEKQRRKTNRALSS